MIDHLHTYLDIDKSLMYVYANHFYPDLAFCDSTAGSAEPRRLEEVCRNLFLSRRQMFIIDQTTDAGFTRWYLVWRSRKRIPDNHYHVKKITRSAFNDQNTLIIDHLLLHLLPRNTLLEPVFLNKPRD